jgi:hypothetical protein
MNQTTKTLRHQGFNLGKSIAWRLSAFVAFFRTIK